MDPGDIFGTIVIFALLITLIVAFQGGSISGLANILSSVIIGAFVLALVVAVAQAVG